MAGRGGKRGGRKRGTPNKVTAEFRKSLSELARAHTEEGIATLVDVMRGDHPMARVKAVELLFNRGYGLPVQPNEGADGGPVQVQIVKFADAPVRKPAR